MQRNEEETRADLIDPKLMSGWTASNQNVGFIEITQLIEEEF